MNPPHIVIEGTTASVSSIVDGLRATGWTIVPSWTGPAPLGGRCIRVGIVASAQDAETALMAALGGFGIVVQALGERRLIDTFVDDLRRLGPVDHRTVDDRPGPVMPDDARAILGLLAEGHSLGEAAYILGLSRRTADRRLAAARTALGVERTTEAIAAAKRLGWLRGGSGQTPP